MPEDTKKDKKEKTLSLKANTKSSKSTIGTRSRGGSRVSTVVVESKRGKISKTRKPSAPNIKTRTSSVTSRKIKEPTENDVFGALTDICTDLGAIMSESTLLSSSFIFDFNLIFFSVNGISLL